MWKRIVQSILGKAGTMLLAALQRLRDGGAFDRALELAQVEVARLAGVAEMDGDAKRRTALASLRTLLAAEGRQIGNSLLSLALELAVAEMKAATAR